MTVARKFRIVLTAGAVAAAAQVFALSVNTDGQLGVVRTLTAKTMGKAALNTGVGLSIYQSNKYVDDVQNPQGEIISIDQPNREAARMLSSNLFAGLGLTNFWDLSLSLPFFYDWLGFDQKQDGGLGDLEFGSKFLYPAMNKRLFYQAYYVGATVPTGMTHAGFFPRHPYYIEGNDTNPATTFYSSSFATFKGLILWTFDVASVAPQVPLRFHLNLGGVITSSMKHQRNTAIGGLGIEYSPADVVTFAVDFHGESRWSNFSTSIDPSSDPMVFSPSVKLTTQSGLYLHFAGDFSLSSRARSTRLNWHPDRGPAAGYQYSTGIFPNYGIQFMLGWNGFLVTPDADHDGIPDAIDKCKKSAEDFDKFQDDDGCPDYDNDNDGIPDSLDKCPNDPEDKDGFKDSDGCPDADNDLDGISDSHDRCPNLAEDFDGFQDQDGCPDFDNDKDGVPDSLDRCPNDPEDKDGIQDSDGCPDIDNDQDGVPDLKDKCPNVPGPADNSGCPKVDTIKPPVRHEPDFPRNQILYGIEFRKGTAELTFASYQHLEPLVQRLKANPEVSIEIHGHVDAMGSYNKNMSLSQMRAESVRQYLIAKGVPPERLRAVGFGSSSPLADNKTAAGRAQNRRIEIVRVR